MQASFDVNSIKSYNPPLKQQNTSVLNKQIKIAQDKQDVVDFKKAVSKCTCAALGAGMLYLAIKRVFMIDLDVTRAIERNMKIKYPKP